MLLLVGINCLLYFLLIEFYIEYFPNGSEKYSYELGVEMVEKYGASMDNEEFKDFKEAYKRKVEEANRYLQNREDFVAAGRAEYDKAIEYDRENPDSEANALHDTLFFDSDSELFWELQEYDWIIDNYAYRKTIPDNVTYAQRLRYEELISEGTYGVYPDDAIRNFKHYILNVAVAILFSVVLVISPSILKDRSGGIVPLQYAAKKGRQLFRVKLAAGYIAAFLIITGLLAVYFALYSLNEPSIFFNVHVNTFFAQDSWYDPTFFQFILLCTAAIYVISFMFVTLSMTVSNLVPNLVTLIGVQIPFVAGFLIFGNRRLLPNMIEISVPKWLVPSLYSAMLLLSLFLLTYLIRREKKIDIIH